MWSNTFQIRVMKVDKQTFQGGLHIMEKLVSELLLMEKVEGANIEHLREMLLELSNTEKK
ncbi:hypothetical protein CON08_00605 [Bacillus cereus]|nr:hypothetical protein CON08_00605 [Bacillus cereus]